MITRQPIDWRPAMIVPVSGWVGVFVGLFVPMGRIVWWIWAIDVFLSIVVHPLQLFAALPVGRRAGFSTAETVIYTLVFGATWWKPLRDRFPA